MSGIGARWKKESRKETKSVVGRERYLDTCVSLYNSCKEREATILNFYGVGGIGKSTILNTIRQYAAGHQIPSFFYDLEKHNTVLQFYEKLYTWLQTAPFKTHYFQMGFLVYWQRMHPNIDFKESLPTAIKEGGLFCDIASVMMDDGLGLVKEAVPVLGSMSNILYKSYCKLSTRYRLEKELLDYIGEMEESDMDTEEIEMRLPYLLMQDLQRADFSTQPVPIFLFDTYEKLYESATADKRRKMEAWIENFAAGILDRGMLVVAGREKIDWHHFDVAWNDLIVAHHIDALSTEEARTLIRTHGIETAHIIDAIVDASKGHPFYIELAIDTYKSDPETFDSDAVKHAGQEQLFKRFVGNLGTDYLTILEHLSVTRDFDQELYAYILQKAGIGYSQIVFEELVSYSFFSRKASRYTMHDLMRQSFHTHIAPERLRTLHAIVFDYFDAKITETAKNDRPIDAQTLHTAMYHLLSFADEARIESWFDMIKKALYRHGEYRLLVQLYNNALAHIGDKRIKIRFMIELGLLHIDMDDYEALKQRVDELNHTVVPIDLLDDIDYLRTKKNLIYAETRTRPKYREHLLKKSENALLKVIQKSDTTTLKSRAHIELANMLRKRGEFFRAQSTLFTALHFTGDPLLKAKIYDKLGYLQRDMKRYDEARQSFIEAIEIKKRILAPRHIELGKSYRGLSQILYKLKQYDSACEVTREAIAAFIAFYGKWSPIVRNEYKALIRYCPDADAQNIEHDKTLRLLARLEIAAASKDTTQVSALAETLRKDQEEMTEKYPVMAEILIKNFPNEAQSLLDEAYEAAQSDIRRWHLTLHAYLIFRKNRQYEDARQMLDRMLDLSRNLEPSRHVSDLQKAAFFYAKTLQTPEKAALCYEDAISLLSERGGDHFKAAQLCRLRAGLCGKNYDEKLHWLHKAIDLYRNRHHLHEEAETMNECATIHIARKAYDTAESLLHEIMKRYESAGDLARADTVQGRLADLYERIGKEEEALSCYYRQLQLRQKLRDDFRLAKGYKFLADYYLKKRNDPKNAEMYYRKGVDITLAGGKGAEEMIEMHTYTLMRFYQHTGESEKEKEIIDLRMEQARRTENLTFERLAFKDLEFFHSRAKAYEAAVQTAERSLALYPLSKFPLERLAIVTRILNYLALEKHTDPNRRLRFMLQKYELLLITGKKDEATACFMELTEFTRNAGLHEAFLQHYKALLGNFTVTTRYDAYAQALSHYRLYDPATRWHFLYKQLHRFQKLTGPVPDSFHRVHSRLRQIKANNEAALFYERFFTLRIAELKGRFDEQATLYKEAMETLKKLNNQVVTRRFKAQYEAFQARLSNLHLINGRAIDPVIKPVLDNLLPNFRANEPLPERFERFVKRCENEPALIARLEAKKLNPSVILQGIKAIDPDFSSYRYGFDSTTPFLQRLFCGTRFQLARSQNGATYIVAREAAVPDMQRLPDIVDARSYIHEKENYAKLLSAAFLEGEGLFFSENPLLEQRFYRFVSDYSFVQVTFDEIFQTVLSHLKIKEAQDHTRIENLIRNLYYADCFLVENRYEILKAQIVTQKVTGQELYQRLKTYGKRVLQKMITEVDEPVYEMLWL